MEAGFRSGGGTLSGKCIASASLFEQLSNWRYAIRCGGDISPYSTFCTPVTVTHSITESFWSTTYSVGNACETIENYRINFRKEIINSCILRSKYTARILSQLRGNLQMFILFFTFFGWGVGHVLGREVIIPMWIASGIFILWLKVGLILVAICSRKVERGMGGGS